ncbi:hypothetical protein AB0A60_33805 [Streptomyces sp. NPDC046275]|uniref:hypothetical protein n=1 Tax=Streptomyces sp. NPDC046275 TaxID=3157201 RepID=UPI0033DA8A50
MPGLTDSECGPDWGVLRAHDLWVLPVEMLTEVMEVGVVELELPKGPSAFPFWRSNSRWIAVQSGLPPDERNRLVRHLLFSCLTEAVGGGEWKAPLRAMDIRTLYAGSQWEPMDGWRGDEVAIDSLRSFVGETLGGVAEDFPEEAYPLPGGVGAIIAFGYDAMGKCCPLVWVDARLSSGLRADLWGFCIAQIAEGDVAEREADAEGILYIGKRRRPVRGPGPALLAALTVQRFGRRPGDCDFPLLSGPEREADPTPA